ncbi:MAG: hypothetical protein ABI898_09875 [Sphingomonadales bacterium]
MSIFVTRPPMRKLPHIDRFDMSDFRDDMSSVQTGFGVAFL